MLAEYGADVIDLGILPTNGRYTNSAGASRPAKRFGDRQRRRIRGSG